MSSNHFSRRDFIKFGLLGGGALFLASSGLKPNPAFAKLQKSHGGDDDHFFLQVVISGGLDPTYHFDSRPLEMTKAGKLQNYLGKEPSLWTGSNGVSCWATDLTQALKPFKSDFTVLNGVVMATGFDGHDQNMNYLFAGSPFGGPSFIPHLNREAPAVRTETVLDSIQVGTIYASLNNLAGVVPMQPAGLLKFRDKLNSLGDLSTTRRDIAVINDRLQSLSQKPGLFGDGARGMQGAWHPMADLSKRIRALNFQIDSTDNDESGFVKMVAQVFRNQISRTAIYAPKIVGNVDTHDVDSCKAQPVMIQKVMDRLGNLIRLMKGTPYDATRSIWDVTTIMISTEFGRTMLQTGMPIDGTGTDHNPLTNTMLIGGRGIKGGQVLGASDYQTSTDILSKAHGKFDSRGIQIMGAPFDFKNSTPRSDKPVDFNADDYLTMGSVANTIYSLFGVQKSLYRTNVRNGDPAQILTALL